MSEPTSLVWLFDIDGTLLLTQGAGRDALVLALRDAHGVHDDLSSIPFAGRTDRLITNDIATRHGLEFKDEAARHEPQFLHRLDEALLAARGAQLVSQRDS